MVERQETSLLVRIIWFLLIGWWLGEIVISIAWFFMITIIGIPIALWLIDRLPAIITLRPREQYRTAEGRDLLTGQYPLWVRALYFIFIGWWFAFLWLQVAYILMLTIIGIPIAFWMFNQAGLVTTLYRY